MDTDEKVVEEYEKSSTYNDKNFTASFSHKSNFDLEVPLICNPDEQPDFFYFVKSPLLSFDDLSVAITTLP